VRRENPHRSSKRDRPVHLEALHPVGYRRWAPEEGIFSAEVAEDGSAGLTEAGGEPYEAVDKRESGGKANPRPMGKAQPPLWVMGSFPMHSTHRHPPEDGKSSCQLERENAAFRP
jgi:hypothetical protein